MSESDTLPTGGTDTARPLSLDDAMAFDLHDPEEETVDAGPGAQAADRTGETGDGREPEEIDAGAGDDALGLEDSQGEPDETTSEPGREPADDVSITVNGQKVALGALKAGYMRQADYSRKTLAVAQARKGLETMSARVTRSVHAVADFLAAQIPAEPDTSLAMSDPGAFVRQKAMHEAALQQLGAILSEAGDVRGVAGQISAEQQRELLMQENAMLTRRFPATATHEGRKAFFDTAAAAARAIGYSDAEIDEAADHRVFALAHYAALGIQAERARETARHKVRNAPPVAPQRARGHGAQHGGARRNQEAMQRLARSGSIDDAMAIDFD
ncbi:UNVERIFIED_ORG: hypothetical protein LHK14_01640 [Roseateles sp. XES5]|nr:hypothetical protein [Roseateles sp. XES5]